MTKTNRLACLVRRDDIADFDLIAGDHDTIDQQLHQLPLLLEAGLLQSLADPLAELLHRCLQAGELLESIRLSTQLLLLASQCIQTLLQLSPATSVFRQRYHLSKVGLGQPLQLLRQGRLTTTKVVLTRSPFLRQPVSTGRPMQGLLDNLGMTQQLAEILPYQLIQDASRNESRRTMTPGTLADMTTFTRANVVFMIRQHTTGLTSKTAVTTAGWRRCSHHRGRCPGPGAGRLRVGCVRVIVQSVARWSASGLVVASRRGRRLRSSSDGSLQRGDGEDASPSGGSVLAQARSS